MKNLADLYLTHTGKGLDKWTHYLSEYDKLLSGFQEMPISLLEIGIQNGGSLEVFSSYFEHARMIVGCDIDPKCGMLAFGDPRIHIVVGDANSDVAETAVAALSDQYDIIIDDGSHQSGDIVKSFVRYFKYLNNGGLYIAEDLHCSYWDEFQGGLFFPFSSMSFFKRLVDVVNHEHWGLPVNASSLLSGFAAQYGTAFDAHLLASIHSIEFSNSICVIRKCSPEQNQRGQRVLAGSVYSVEPISATASAQMSSANAFPQDCHYWSAMQTPPEEHYEVLMEESAERELLVEQASERDLLVAQLTAHVSALENSLSWRITQPLRFINTWLHRLFSR